MPHWTFLASSAAALAAGALAQDFPIPDLSGDIICDGTIRPDYAECRDVLLPQTLAGTRVGPGFMQGQTFAGSNCQFRALKCGSSGPAHEFDIDFSSMFPGVDRQCGRFPAGGVYRSGDACIYVDTPNNTFGPRPPATMTTGRDDPDADLPGPVSVAALERVRMLELGRETKRARRDLVRESLEPPLRGRQCDPPAGPCYKDQEQVFLTGVRGHQQRVCDSILPKGGAVRPVAGGDDDGVLLVRRRRRRGHQGGRRRLGLVHGRVGPLEHRDRHHRHHHRLRARRLRRLVPPPRGLPGRVRRRPPRLLRRRLRRRQRRPVRVQQAHPRRPGQAQRRVRRPVPLARTPAPARRRN